MAVFNLKDLDFSAGPNYIVHVPYLLIWFNFKILSEKERNKMTDIDKKKVGKE